jgi:hypothetical protein
MTSAKNIMPKSVRYSIRPSSQENLSPTPRRNSELSKKKVSTINRVPTMSHSHCRLKKLCVLWDVFSDDLSIDTFRCLYASMNSVNLAMQT